jgi:hypothetical protein
MPAAVSVRPSIASSEGITVSLAAEGETTSDAFLIILVLPIAAQCPASLRLALIMATTEPGVSDGFGYNQMLARSVLSVAVLWRLQRCISPSATPSRCWPELSPPVSPILGPNGAAWVKLRGAESRLRELR